MDYGAVLVGLCVASAALRNRQLFLTAVALFLNHRALVGWYELTGEQFDWVINALADYAAGMFIVAAGRRTVGQCLVLIGYVTALIWHLKFSMTDQGAVAQYRYWYEMSWTAWAQALVVFLGGVIGGGRRIIDQVRSRRRRVPRGLGAGALGNTRAHGEPGSVIGRLIRRK
jgi:hypothetical protein